MSVDLHKLTKDFLIGESKEAGLLEYLSVVSEMLDNFKPQRESDRSRLAVMRENLRKAKRHARLMEERLKILEEQVKIIEEAKEDEE